VFALEEGRRLDGEAEGTVRFRAALTPGLPQEIERTAGAWTAWLPLGPRQSEAIEVQVEGARGEIAVYVQLASAHAIDPGRPFDEEPYYLTPPTPVPAPEPLHAPFGAFMRVGLEARVRGSDLPSIAGFVVHER
jgi:hypothetical protein